MTNQLFQWEHFQLGEGFVSITENPIHGTDFIIENHFDVCKGEWCIFIAAIMLAICFISLGRIVRSKTTNDGLLFLTKSVDNFFFAAYRVFQRFAVDEIHRFCNVLNRDSRHQTPSANFQKIFPQLLFQFSTGDSCGVYFSAIQVYFRILFLHDNIKNSANIQFHMLPFGRNVQCSCGIYAIIHSLVPFVQIACLSNHFRNLLPDILFRISIISFFCHGYKL
ncbi:unknown [Ruminococcus sp. CAG:254]|nr:unknown [Ruminococcus sp. CAG:254]